MNGLNRMCVAGFLGADAELRYTQSGIAVADFSVAANESWLKDGVKQEHVEWIRCTIWQKRAEALAPMLKKGTGVYVEGQLRTTSYEKDGVKHYQTKVNVTEIILMGAAPVRDEPRGARPGAGHGYGGQGAGGGYQAAPTGGQARGAAGAGSGPVASDADLDGQYGDPVVKFSPKRWEGTDFKGAPMSTCSPDFLDCLAEALQWSSENPKPGKEKYASYDAKDAARARGWAARIRRGGAQHRGVGAPPAQGGAAGDDYTSTDDYESAPDSIPFLSCAFSRDPMLKVMR